MNKFTIIVFLFLTSTYGNELDVFKNYPWKKNLWNLSNNTYYKLSYLTPRDRLSKLKSTLMRKCKDDNCLLVYGHMLSFLFYKDILKRRDPKEYLEKIDRLNKEQVKITYKCQDNSDCEFKVINEYCDLKGKVSILSKPFCVSAFFVSLRDYKQ